MDRDLGDNFANTLRSAGLEVRAHREVFPEETTGQFIDDGIWIRKCGLNGWVAITRDRLEAREDICREIQESKTRIFMMRGKKTFPQLAADFVEGLPQIRRFLKKNDGPFVAAITTTRRVINEWRETSEVEIKPKETFLKPVPPQIVTSK